MAVDPYKGEIYPISFGSSGMIAHENRWLAQRTELVLADNVTFENDVLQKDPAISVYDPIGVDAQFYRMTASSTASAPYEAGCALMFGFTGTPTLIKNIVSPGQTSPWTFTVAATAPASSVMILSVYAPSVDVPVITDSKGNLYVYQVGFGLTGAPSDPAATAYFQYIGNITTQLTNGVDTITLTFTNGPGNFLLIATTYPTTGATSAIATASATSTTITCPANSPAPFVGLTNCLYPMIGVGAVFFGADTATATVTGTLKWTKFATANRVGVGQLCQLYTSVLITRPSIVAQYDWNAQFNAGAVAGTVTVTQNVTTVQGAGTSFLTDFSVNDEIIVNNEVHAIASITNNTTLDTYTAWIQTTAAGQTAKRRSGPHIITAVINQALGPSTLSIYKERTPNVTPLGIFPGLGGQLLLTDTNQPRLGRFVVAGKESSAQSRKLFFFNGCEPVNYLADDAATMVAIGTPPADWGAAVDPNKQPVNGILHQGALFGWGNLSDPHRIYRSQTTDHTTFTGGDSGQYPIASSIGERLWCGAEYQGVLFLWKYPRGIFYFDDTDTNFINWSYHVRSEAIGCAPSPHAVLPVDDDVIFCAPDGHFHLLSAVPDLGGVNTSDLTRQLGLHRWTREHIDIPSLALLSSAYNSYSKIAYFGVRSRTAATQDNDLLLKFDFGLVKRGGPIRFSYSTAYRPNALCLRRSASAGNPKDGTPLLMIGEVSTSWLQVLDDGTVGTKLTHGFRNDPARESRYTSTSYPITVQTPRLDFGDIDPMNRQRKKNYDSLEFVFGESDISDLSGQTITAQIYVDSVLKQTITVANISRTRELRQLRCGDGFDWQVKLSTSSVVSAVSATPTLIPDIVGLGLHIYWRPGSQDHPNVIG